MGKRRTLKRRILLGIVGREVVVVRQIGIDVSEQPVLSALFCAEDMRRTVQRLQYNRRDSRLSHPRTPQDRKHQLTL